MTIAFDAVTTGDAAGVTSKTLSHTCGVGADRVVIVFATCWNSDDLFSGATYAGTSMGAPALAVGTNQNWLKAWILVNPPSGANDVVVSFTSSAYAAIAVISFSGVDQTTPVSATNGGFSAYWTSPKSLSISTPTDGLAVDFFARRSPSATLTPAASQTERANFADAVGKVGVSHKADATAMEWAFSTGDFNTAFGILALAAAAAGAAELAGTATASATATGDLTTTPAIKGVSIQLGDGTPAASLTGLSVRWWDAEAPTGAPDYESDTETTDASGWLEIDLSAVTALAVGANGYLHVFKAGATPADDIVAAGRVPISDIA